MKILQMLDLDKLILPGIGKGRDFISPWGTMPIGVRLGRVVARAVPVSAIGSVLMESRPIIGTILILTGVVLFLPGASALLWTGFEDRYGFARRARRTGKCS